MNGLLIITGIIFLICVIVGFVRGFIKIIASLAATVAIIVLVIFLTPYVSKGILKFTPLESTVQKKCVDIFTPEAGELDLSGIEIPRDQQIAAIEHADIPELFREMLLENNNSEIYEELGVSTFGEYVGTYLAKVIADFAGFLLTLLVVTIVVRTIVYAFGLISDLPVIGGLNRIAGGILGMVTGILIVWVIMIIITLLYTTTVGEICFQNIADSQILTFLYDNNPLLEAITKFR